MSQSVSWFYFFCVISTNWRKKIAIDQPITKVPAKKIKKYAITIDIEIVSVVSAKIVAVEVAIMVLIYKAKMFFLLFQLYPPLLVKL